MHNAYRACAVWLMKHGETLFLDIDLSRKMRIQEANGCVIFQQSHSGAQIRIPRAFFVID